MSVTSSGRSSISRIIICISGTFFRIDFATSFRSVVLPAFGGDTIIPRCPFPTGLIKSIMRIATLAPGVSSRIRSLGKIGVMSSKLRLRVASSGGYPFTFLRYKSALNFSFIVLIRVFPSMMSPVRSPKRRIWLGATYTSFSPGRKFSLLMNPNPSGMTSRIPLAITPLSSSDGNLSSACLSCCLSAPSAAARGSFTDRSVPSAACFCSLAGRSVLSV